jgi:glycosyltransferase involved in cell wall biosynthesis
MTRIAVCLASYQGAGFIAEQIQSILPQLQPGDRIYLSDDGSSDSTVEIASGLSASVTVVGAERVGGVVANFERALAAAYAGDAELFVLCDQDDVWLPGRLELIRSGLDKHDLLLLDGLLVDGALAPMGKTISAAVGVRAGFWRNLGKNSFIGCCMAFRRSVLDATLPFPKGIWWHDWYIGLVAEVFFDIKRYSEHTMLYRRHGGNHSPTGEKSRYGLGKKLAIRLTMVRALAVTCARLLAKGRRTGGSRGSIL